MHAFSTSMVVQAGLALMIAIVATSWWLTVPGLMTPSTFVAVSGILAGSVWVVKSTYENARPASSLAQSLHDIETTAASKRTRRGSSNY